MADPVSDSSEHSVDPHWYKRAVFYEVLVRGFADSNGDGTGDLKGLVSKLDYLQLARHRLHLAAADLPVTAARRRVRHLRLLHDPARVR